MNLKIDWIGGKCPVQAEGTINSTPFYFRARGNRWAFDVNDGEWYYEEQYGDEPFAAGWMEEDEAIEFINVAAKMYVSSTDGIQKNGKCTDY